MPFLVIFLLSAFWLPGGANAADKGKFSDWHICRATIAGLMGRDPSIISIDKVFGREIYLSYIRANDKKKWSYKCKIDGNKVLWGTAKGNWRLRREHSKLTFRVAGEIIIITEKFSDGSFGRYTFRLADFSK